ncbi:MAG: hypothetical protein BGO88_02365 [Flavobacterium sp. 38-13]|uniref:T9SS-dependent choice-of-anchor J family protein n=1 Tax=Flavobacterium sp. 38-13 TaxID=1896168 RepID=UPI000961C7B0|nr:choice-of-anchor J domain-containing protein [Flavobacterium sp. 38-13]OJX55812.1 MAG: hypothetical protein BGO88_02365 [Flavobacterium sp. 38-13]
MKKILLLSLTLLGFNQAAKSQIVFQENWDGAGPGIAGWTLYNVDNKTPNAAVNFVNAAWISTGEEFDNKVAMSTSYYTPVGASNDWLVSPSIAIPAGSSRLYWDAKAYDATYRDSYKVFISTSGNAVANFTTQLFAQGDGTTGASGENTAWTRRFVDLTAYAGQNVYIAFQNFSNDMFLLGIDNIHVVNNLTCAAPERVITNVINPTSATISWTAVAGATGYDIAIGAPGFIPTVTGTSATNSYTTTTPLTPNTRYQYYVRNSCGSVWVGPFSFFTPISLPYTYGFETPAASGGYNVDGWSGAFSLNNTAGAPFYADGVQMSFSNSSTTAATNRWLFSRPISLAAGEQVTLKFSTRSTSATINNTLLAKIGNAPTIAAQTTTLSTVTVVGLTFVETTATYTAPSAGIYYISFNHNNPATPAGGTSIVLDKIVMTSVLGTNEFSTSKLSVYPNPSNGIVNISSDSNVLLNNVSISDLNGRTVKSVELNGDSSAQVNISDLSAGVYMMNINSDQGSVTKKIIKN